jgi:hypothetical protein
VQNGPVAGSLAGAEASTESGFAAMTQACNRAPWSVALIGPLVISALHQYEFFFCDNFNKKI